MPNYPLTAPNLPELTDASPAAPVQHALDHTDERAEIEAIGADLVAARGTESDMAAKVAAMAAATAAAQGTADDAIPTAAKGAADGVAELDSGGTIPQAQIPAELDANARIDVAGAGTLIGTRRRLNLIATGGLALVITDHAGSETIDVEVRPVTHYEGVQLTVYGSSMANYGPHRRTARWPMRVARRLGMVAGNTSLKTNYVGTQVKNTAGGGQKVRNYEENYTGESTDTTLYNPPLAGADHHQHDLGLPSDSFYFGGSIEVVYDNEPRCSPHGIPAARGSVGAGPPVVSGLAVGGGTDHRFAWTPNVVNATTRNLDGDTGVVVLQMFSNIHDHDAAAVAMWGRNARGLLRFLMGAPPSGNTGLHDFGATTGWVANSWAFAHAGTYAYTITPGATYTFTVNGPEFTIGYVRFGAGTNTSDFAVSIDGVPQGTVAGGAGWTAANIYDYFSFTDTVRYAGLSAGAHTVVITKDGTTTQMGLDWWTTPHAAKPAVLFVKEKGPWYSALMEAELDAICAEAEFAGVAYAVDLPAWDNAAMTVDSIHPNDVGSDYIATEVCNVLAGVAPRNGIQQFA